MIPSVLVCQVMQDLYHQDQEYVPSLPQVDSQSRSVCKRGLSFCVSLSQSHYPRSLLTGAPIEPNTAVHTPYWGHSRIWYRIWYVALILWFLWSLGLPGILAHSHVLGLCMLGSWTVAPTSLYSLGSLCVEARCCHTVDDMRPRTSGIFVDHRSSGIVVQCAECLPSAVIST